MLENYVNKGAFRYIVGKRTHTAPEKEISMIIKGDTVFILILFQACL